MKNRIVTIIFALLSTISGKFCLADDVEKHAAIQGVTEKTESAPMAVDLAKLVESLGITEPPPSSTPPAP